MAGWRVLMGLTIAAQGEVIEKRAREREPGGQTHHFRASLLHEFALLCVALSPVGVALRHHLSILDG